MRYPIFYSLKYRIALIVFVLELILLTSVLGVTLNYIETRASDDMLDRRTVFFNLVKGLTQDSLFAGEYEDLQTFIDKISRDKEIIDIIVVNDRGTVVANNDLEQVGTKISMDIQKGNPQWLYEEINGLGAIYVKFSERVLEEQLAAAQNLGFIIAMSGIGIIAMVSLLFGFLLTRRLQKLTVAINKFQHHNQKIDVEVSGRDEVAVLSNSFNFMSSEINSYIHRLRQEQEQLEARVLKRTQDLNEAKEELIKKNQELKLLSITDHLTGIYNRAHLEEILSRHIANNLTSHKPFGVILVDIDHFKRINDTFGHDVGDAIIKTVAHVINSSLRDDDVLGRWGGEEYLIICPEIDVKGLVEIAERIHKAIKNSRSPKISRITASLGVAHYNLGDNENTLLKRADLALYQAKNAGRDCIKIQRKSVYNEMFVTE